MSLPILFEKLKQESMVSCPLGQFVSEKLSRFSHEDGGSVKAATMDERASELLQHATTGEETKAISKCKHVTLLYSYRNYFVHESREPGYAMGVFEKDGAPYCRGYLGKPEWHLGYPFAMFGLLVRNGLVGFRSCLKENAINPYSALDDVKRW